MRRACGMALALSSALCFCLALQACADKSDSASYSIASGGNARRGKQLIRAYGCGACHIVPGIRTARGLVGPPLTDFGERAIIAGELPNTPANLVSWIENARAIEPKNAMPDLGVTQQQATDMAAYLYTLRSDKGEQ
jgi:cytochrome c1